MRIPSSIAYFGGLVLVAVVSYRLGMTRHATGTPAAPVRESSQVAGQDGKILPIVEQIKSTREHWEKRLETIRSLPDRLDEAQAGQLFDFLRAAPDSDRGGWYLAVNEVMEVMRKRSLAGDSYAREMLALLVDGGADPVVRDYAAQHLAQWVAGMDQAAGKEADEVLATECIQQMLRAALAPDSAKLTLAGTTLNALADGVINGRAFLREQRPAVADVAFDLASGDTASPINRASALQVMARLGHDGTRGLSRQWIESSTTPANLRLSAIAALGLVGMPEDRRILAPLADDARFAFAARAALERLAQL